MHVRVGVGESLRGARAVAIADRDERRGVGVVAHAGDDGRGQPRRLARLLEVQPGEVAVGAKLVEGAAERALGGS